MPANYSEPLCLSHTAPVALPSAHAAHPCGRGPRGHPGAQTGRVGTPLSNPYSWSLVLGRILRPDQSGRHHRGDHCHPPLIRQVGPRGPEGRSTPHPMAEPPAAPQPRPLRRPRAPFLPWGPVPTLPPLSELLAPGLTPRHRRGPGATPGLPAARHLWSSPPPGRSQRFSGLGTIQLHETQDMGTAKEMSLFFNLLNIYKEQKEQN